ncbi:cyclin-dependent kinase inhibitor 3-like isoform X2 [Primulina tabacum]|uniref:cyclin-dependent kinase inhibitor 3-like isoform X2 n=1 Tax=Primulina tabacum TaxID=48773 RepID=UPI003F59BAEF
MGKYIRKAEATTDVPVMDSSLGVRTRSKTLAFRRLQSTGAAPSLGCLELRSRRLEKSQTSRKLRRSCRCGRGALVEVEASLGENVLDTEVRESKYSSYFWWKKPVLGVWNFRRDTRESTPCSSTVGSNPGPAPGSSASNRRGPPNPLFMNVPTPFELEEFFIHEEQALQRLFTEKYNFDFVNELPVLGHYEWVKVSP